jgi:hypothetical protein
MSEKNLGKALLRGEDPIDVQAMTRRVLRRDRWRVGVLSIVCFAAWMAVVMLPWAIVLPATAKVALTVMGMNAVPGVQGVPSTQNAQAIASMFQVLKVSTILTFATSIGSMCIAALFTVILIVVSRRATLRQVNARLAEISEQIKKLASPAK